MYASPQIAASNGSVGGTSTSGESLKSCDEQRNSILLGCFFVLLILTGTALADATLSGTIVDAADGTTPVHPVQVELLNPVSGEPLGISLINESNGAYEFAGLVPGDYRVFFSAQTHGDELYDDVSCEDGNCDRNLIGNVLTVDDGLNTLNIDLTRLVLVSGTVTDENEQPLSEVAIDVLNDTGSLVGFAVVTNELGEWQKGLPGQSTFYIRTVHQTTPGHLAEAWDDVQCIECDAVALGDPIVLTGSDLSGVDFQLSSAYLLSGRVTDDSDLPLVKAGIDIFDEQGQRVGSGVFTDEFGEWAKGVPGNTTYYVGTIQETTPEYQAEIWNDVHCSQCNPVLVGQPIVVTSENVADIDFQLSIRRPYSPASVDTLVVAGFEESDNCPVWFYQQEAYERVLAPSCLGCHANVAHDSGLKLFPESDPDHAVMNVRRFCDYMDARTGGENHVLAKALNVHLGHGGGTVLQSDGETYEVLLDFLGTLNEIPPVLEKGTLLAPGDSMMTNCYYTEPVNTSGFTCALKRFGGYDLGELSEFKVNTPSIVLVDRTARQQELATVDPSTLESYCPSDWASDFSLRVEPVDVYSAEDRGGPKSQRLTDLENLMTSARTNWLYRANSAALNAVVENLATWADADALLANDYFENGGAALDINGLFWNTVLAWHAVHDSPSVSPANRTKIDNYLGQIAALQNYEEGSFYGDSPYNADVFNQGWHRAVALMAWGIHSGDDSYFRYGIRTYVRVMAGQLRPDGSNFFESQRGSSAMFYSANSSGYLVLLAEMAMQQGYDLYSVSIDGRTVFSMVDFVAAVVEDETIIHEYTQYQNPNTCTPTQCAGWNMMDFDGFDDNQGEFHLAFMEILRRRFPTHPLSVRLENLFPKAAFTPVMAGTSGGFSTCDFRPVP